MVGGIIVAQAQTLVPGAWPAGEMSIVAALIVLIAVLVFRRGAAPRPGGAV